MICADIEKLYEDRGIPNKYVLTLILAERARQLSDRKGTGLGYDEKFITKAMDDVAEGRVKYKMTHIVTPVEDGINESVEAE